MTHLILKKIGVNPRVRIEEREKKKKNNSAKPALSVFHR